MIPLRGEGAAVPRRQRARVSPEIPDSVVVRKGDAHRLGIAHQLLDQWAVEGIPFEMQLAQWEPEMSDAQRGLFFSWCEIVARHIRAAGQPCSKDSVHDWILGQIFGTEDLGLGRSRPRETLTRPHRKGKVALMEILSRFVVEAQEQFDCTLPRPETWEQDLAEAAAQKKAA